MDGISSTVHPDGIRNTVHPRLRAHRPRVRRPPVSSTTSSAALRLKSAGRSCCCGRRTPPKFCTSPQRGGAAAAPPRRGHAPRAVCLVRRGCSPPSFRGRRLLLFNRAGVHAKVAYRVVVAAAPGAEGGRAPRRAARWPMAGIARCNDRASICRGSRVSTDPGLPSSAEQRSRRGREGSPILAVDHPWGPAAAPVTANLAALGEHWDTLAPRPGMRLSCPVSCRG